MISEKSASVRYLARFAPILSEEDTLGHASAVMRSNNVGALAVAAEGRVIGLIREEDLLEPLSQDSEGGRLLRVGEFAVGDPVTIPADAPPQQALRALQWTGSPALPVVEEDGLYRGMLSRADLLAFFSEDVKPPRIGGMATPIGVYLMGGGHRGGVGDLAMMLNGACMALILPAILYLQTSCAMALEKWTGLPIRALSESAPTGTLTWMDGVYFLSFLLPYVILMLVIRLSPIAGYHAGEHQTVWAIERGEPLTPEAVARMPRPHPRCGTNLIVGLMLFQLFQAINPALAFVVTILFWRRLGYYVQLYLTTRPATRKQIESGIKAGKEVLAKYRENPGVMARQSLFQRIWNFGFLQNIIGMVIVSLILSAVFGINLLF